MKLTYYGTGAGAGIPEIFCDCRVCRYAREKGGKEIRSRSQAVIDGVLSLDYPVDTFLHTAFYGLDMRKVKNVLITHGHRYKVKMTYTFLDKAAQEMGCAIAFFGHTHIPCMEQHRTLLVNPGSAARGHMALLEVENGQPRVELLSY